MSSLREGTLVGKARAASHEERGPVRRGCVVSEGAAMSEYSGGKGSVRGEGLSGGGPYLQLASQTALHSKALEATERKIWGARHGIKCYGAIQGILDRKRKAPFNMRKLYVLAEEESLQEGDSSGPGSQKVTSKRAGNLTSTQWQKNTTKSGRKLGYVALEEALKRK